MHRIIITFFCLLWVVTAAATEETSPNQTLIDKAAECIQSGNLDEALKISLEVEANLEGEEDLNIHIHAYNDLGVIYRRINKNDSALHYYQKALDTAFKLDDKEWLSVLAINLAVFNHNLKHFNDAERYADMAVKYSEQQDDESLNFMACQIASPIKAEVKKYDEALTYARKAWSVADSEDGDDNMRLRCIPSLTAIFDKLGQDDSTFHYIDIGNRLLADCDNNITRIGFLQSRSEIYFRHHRWSDALSDLRVLTNAGGTLNAALYHKIAECLYHLGEYSEAYCYMDTARMWTDSLAIKDMYIKLAEFNVKYETKEKEMLLAEERSQHANQQMKLMAAVLVAVLLIAILIVVLLIVRHRHKLHLMLIRQCAELKETRQYIEGLETERARMARELHDSVSNGLLGVSLKLQGADTTDDIHGVITNVEHLRNEVRTLSHGLMPPEFTRYNLNDALSLYVTGLKNAKVKYTDNTPDGWDSLSKEVSLEVFRIAQECIFNALSHSNADSINVSLTLADDKTTGILRVEDNGTSPDSPSDTSGIGLRIMQERVKSIDGKLDINKQPHGTSIKLFFPI